MLAYLGVSYGSVLGNACAAENVRNTDIHRRYDIRNDVSRECGTDCCRRCRHRRRLLQHGMADESSVSVLLKLER
jgi:hypothetical protein